MIFQSRLLKRVVLLAVIIIFCGISVYASDIQIGIPQDNLIQTHFSSITLAWTASGDDGQNGIAHHYIVKNSTAPIDNASWDQCPDIPNPPVPLPAGSYQSFNVENLIPGELYYFGIKSVDDAGNISGLSNISLRIAAGILTPPARVPIIDSVALAAQLMSDTVHSHFQIFYEFALDTVVDFGHSLVRSDSLVDSIAAVSIFGLSPNLTYYWRNRAIRVDHSDSSFWSEPDSFRISISSPSSPLVLLISPNGRERWNALSEQQITWTDTSQNSISQHKLEYSTDNGSTWLVIRDWLDGDPHSFNWTVPDTPSRRARVRVSCRDSQDNIGSDISNNFFTIKDVTKPRVHVQFPGDGSNIEIGRDTTIIWNAEDNVGVDSFSIDLSTDNGASWNIVSEFLPGNPGSYQWTVPPLISLQSLIRVTCKDPDENISADTSYLFSLNDHLPPAVEILSPLENQPIYGDTIYIEWQASDNGFILNDSAQYSIDDGASWLEITSGSNREEGSYNWETPLFSSGIWLRILCLDQSGNIGADTIMFNATSAEDSHQLPSEFALYNPFPNPFNPAATVKFALPEPSHVKIEIFDILGVSIAVLIDQYYPAGVHQTVWVAEGLPSGTYLLRLQTEKFHQTNKLLLLK